MPPTRRMRLGSMQVDTFVAWQPTSSTTHHRQRRHDRQAARWFGDSVARCGGAVRTAHSARNREFAAAPNEYYVRRWLRA